MKNTDLIARVYPYDNELGHSKKAIKASWRYMLLMYSSEKEVAPSRNSRKSIQPKENLNNLDRLLYFKLRFNDVLRIFSGLVFKTDPNINDIILFIKVGFNKRHIALTYKNRFDNKCYCLVMRNLGSKYKTWVGYNGKAKKEWRNNFN